MRELLRFILCLSGSLIAIGPTASVASPGEPPQRAISRVNRALAGADLGTLIEMRNGQDSVARILAGIAIERVHFNLDKSSADAKACEAQLHDTLPNIAFYCARFVSSNLRLAGRTREASLEEIDVVRRYQGLVPASLLDNFDFKQAPAFAALPDTKVILPTEPSSIPVKKSQSRNTTVEVTINGKAVTLKVDTGAPTILGAETAGRLGVRIVLQKDGVIRGALGKESVKQLGILDRLSFGGVTMENLPVAVIPEEHNALGMDVLKRLGAFELTQTSLVIYGTGRQQPVCNEPLLVSSTFVGATPAVVHAIKVNGVSFNALMDSGSDFYLTQMVRGDATDHASTEALAIKDVNQSGQSVQSERITANVELGGVPRTATFTSLRGTAVPYDYILGNGAFKDVSLFVDFDHRRSCLIPVP
ncbi:TIGR02281 family clan AA aspartic protease [Xanthomonas sp. NCPPB 2632]|uniref:retropepsin-like aspartic protease family protein n=1 Tax=Xanthomonas sp. NCPPB 2632 TaxID=3240912 RepID=UPI0035133F79